MRAPLPRVVYRSKGDGIECPARIVVKSNKCAETQILDGSWMAVEKHTGRLLVECLLLQSVDWESERHTPEEFGAMQATSPSAAAHSLTGNTPRRTLQEIALHKAAYPTGKTTDEDAVDAISEYVSQPGFVETDEDEYDSLKADRDRLLEALKAAQTAFSNLNGEVSLPVWKGLYEVVTKATEAIRLSEGDKQ